MIAVLVAIALFMLFALVIPVGIAVGLVTLRLLDRWLNLS